MTRPVSTYECALCHGTFEYGDEEEAVAEVLEVFGVAHSPDDAIVCDNCWEEVKP